MHAPLEDAPSSSPFPLVVYAYRGPCTDGDFVAFGRTAASCRAFALESERAVEHDGSLTEEGYQEEVDNGLIVPVLIEDADRGASVLAKMAGCSSEEGVEMLRELLDEIPGGAPPFVFAAMAGSVTLARTFEGLPAAARANQERWLAENPDEGYTRADLDEMVAAELADGVPVLIQAADELAAFKAWREFGWNAGPGLEYWRAAFPAPEGVDPVAALVEAEEREEAEKEKTGEAREAQDKEQRRAEAAVRAAEEAKRQAERDAELAVRDPLPEGLPARFADTKHRVGLWGHVGAAMWDLPAEALGRVARFIDAEISGAPAFPMTVYVVADAHTTGLRIVERSPDAARERLECWLRELYPHSDRDCTEDAFVASAMKTYAVVPILVDRAEDGPSILAAVIKIHTAEAEGLWADLLAEPTGTEDQAEDDIALADIDADTDLDASGLEA